MSYTFYLFFVSSFPLPHKYKPYGAIQNIKIYLQSRYELKYENLYEKELQPHVGHTNSFNFRFMSIVKSLFTIVPINILHSDSIVFLLRLDNNPKCLIFVNLIGSTYNKNLLINSSAEIVINFILDSSL